MSQYEQLVEDLKRNGINKGMVVLVHSSFKSLGFTEGNPELVIKAFQEVLTEEGTLMMPTLTYQTVTRMNPFYSYHDTPSCVGIISETFRKQEKVIRSLNPVHSVACWGKHAEELTKNHHLDKLTLGPNSPFQLALNYDLKILMIGCGLKPNTFMHLVENINDIDYRKTKYTIRYTMIDESNQVKKQLGYLPDMSQFEQHYERVELILNDQELKTFKLLNANCHLIDANALLLKAGEVLKVNSHFFVDEK